jgi:SpoVK/Ycf46/Vps4 family AAA+-type ATPase
MRKRELNLAKNLAKTVTNLTKSDKVPEDEDINKYRDLFRGSKVEDVAGFLNSFSPEVYITGIPDSVPERVAAQCRSQLLKAVTDLISQTNLQSLEVSISTSQLKKRENTRALPPSSGPVRPVTPSINPHTPADVFSGPGSASKSRNPELTMEERAAQYVPQQPLYTFNFLAVSEEVKETLLAAIDVIRLDQKLFHEWNLKEIEPFPRTALNFFGPPGTGKTLAAHALAHYLNAPIMMASYAQIESKFHGDGPKNVEALFYAAQRDKAVLFIDEADSLLSKRFTDVSQGLEQSINSMRGQLMVSLERYQGIVIFATNLIESYDKAFETRVRHIEFPLPDEKSRREIWLRHLPRQLPLSDDVSIEELAKIDSVCGRDIKNAVIDAAIRAARAKKNFVTLQDLVVAVERIKTARNALKNGLD